MVPPVTARWGGRSVETCPTSHLSMLSFEYRAGYEAFD